ncbi:MAG: PA2779 family protein [Nitrospirae bacterium]|nr:PA2779 family protein [Nitrospirota bacterium]
MKIPFLKGIALYLVLAMSVLSVVPRVDAAMVESGFLNLNQQRHEDLDRIQRFLESKIVSERLKTLGYDQNEIRQKLSQLSNEELHQFASSVEQLRTAGDGLGVVVTLLVIAILVVLLLQLTGHRVVVVED